MKFYITLFMLCLSLFGSSICLADDTKFRLGAGVGLGVLVAGDKHATGGLSLSPSILVGLKFKPWIGMSYQNLPNVNTFNSVTALGILDQNTMMLTLAPSDNVIFDLGPSLDIFSMVLCNNQDMCDRQTGLAGGAHVRAAFIGKMMSVGFGIVVNVHGSYIPSRLYNGPIFTTSIGPVWEW